MTREQDMAGKSNTPDRGREVAEEAQARLDEIRHLGGMPLTGEELARRQGENEPGVPPPPLDWRLTPKNVVLQLLAAALFAAVVWFLISLTTDNLRAIFG